VDPPYVHETRQSAHRYKFEMDEAQHRQLAKVLKKVKGKVVLSGYASVLYHELYRKWGFKARPSLADGAKPRMEYLWFNF
jgi:DNA adenine methylase